jgi:hypothetical protein
VLLATVLLSIALLSGCTLRAPAGAGDDEAFRFERHELVTGFLLGGAMADLAVLRVDEDGDPGGYHEKPTIDLAFAIDLATTPSAFENLGAALAGTNGVPALTGSGSLAPATPVTLAASDLLASASYTLIVGVSQLDAPFAGGTLVPSPDVFVVLATDASGGSVLSSTWPTGVPSGVQFFLQAWQADAGAVAGWAATNGLAGTTP